MGILLTALPWVISCMTIASVWLVGNKERRGWAIGIACQFLWLIFILSTQEWGLMPLNVAMWYVNIRNYTKWTTK